MGNPLIKKSGARAPVRSRGTPHMPFVAPRAPTPGRQIPTEIGLEIIELALIATPSSTLSAVSKKFNALVCKIIYKTVVLTSLSRVALFHRTVLSKSPEFMETHVRTLAVTCVPLPSYTTAARIQLEEIVAACTGLRTIAIPRPGILASAAISATRPSELIIQGFDAVTPFEWDPLFDSVDSPAAHLSQNISHLRICEPGAVWHSPLATLEFFGPLPGLTHLALAHHVKSAGNPTDAVFVAEIRTLLETRPNLKMLVVHLFPVTRWYYPTVDESYNYLCKVLLRVADKRLIVLAAGRDRVVEEQDDRRFLWDAVKWTYATFPNEFLAGHDFWENWSIPE